MSNTGKIVLAVLLTLAIVILIGVGIFISATPTGITIWNNWTHSLQKADDNSNYETLKKVEDTCRAMIASYNADKLTYQQYKDSDNQEKQEWAEQAKMRANKTASSYNEYIRKNSYVWAGNVPSDIDTMLPPID